MRAIWLGVLLVSTGPSFAGDLDDCDFNKVRGSCTGRVIPHKDSNSYEIPANGTCRTVTVQIDSTQYPHKIKDRPVSDSVMVLLKGKEYSISVSSCTLHPTRQEVQDSCKPALEAVMAPCRQKRLSMGADCTASAQADSNFDGAACWSRTQDATEGCYAASADAINACIGARAYKLLRTSNFIGIGPTGEY